MALPCYVVWGIWVSVNKMIFQGIELSLAHVSHKTKSACEGS
jgi:hypothetical protein